MTGFMKLSEPIFRRASLSHKSANLSWEKVYPLQEEILADLRMLNGEQFGNIEILMDGGLARKLYYAMKSTCNARAAPSGRCGAAWRVAGLS